MTGNYVNRKLPLLMIFFLQIRLRKFSVFFFFLFLFLFLLQCMSRWENGKIITEANPVAEGKGKAQKFVREISNDELIQVIYLFLLIILISHD